MNRKSENYISDDSAWWYNYISENYISDDSDDSD